MSMDIEDDSDHSSSNEENDEQETDERNEIVSKVDGNIEAVYTFKSSDIVKEDCTRIK